MACDSSFFEKLQIEHKFAFHRAHVESVKDILKSCLAPWDTLSDGPQEDGSFCPRPGHVYLGFDAYSLMEPYLDHIRNYDEGEIVANYCVVGVRTKHLDPKSINPDEDSYWHHESNQPLHSACSHKPIAPFSFPELDASNYHSFGEWAEGIKLGEDPSHTECGISKTETFAYRGSIKAKHLHLFEFYAKRKQASLVWKMRPAKELLGFI